MTKVQHRHGVADAHHHIHVVLDQDDGDAVIADLADDLHQLFDVGRRQASSGLVEQQELRVERQSAGNFNDGGQIVFATGYPDANGQRTESARISPQGYVGIGTSHPQYQLDIWDQNSGTLRVGSATNQTLITSTASGLSVSPTPPALISFGNGAFVIDTMNSYAGVGTPSPASDMQLMRVASGAVGPVLSFFNATDTLGDAAQIRFDVGAYLPNSTITVMSDIDSNTAMIFRTRQDGMFGEAMRINGGGNVGIAESNPTDKLVVGGVISSYAGFRLPDGHLLTSLADVNAAQVADSAPTPAGTGSLWWDSTSGHLYIYYQDSWIDTAQSGNRNQVGYQLINDTASAVLTNDGILSVSGSLRLPLTTKSSSDPGEIGQLAYDDEYIYVFTQSGWKRSQLLSF